MNFNIQFLSLEFSLLIRMIEFYSLLDVQNFNFCPKKWNIKKIYIDISQFIFWNFDFQKLVTFKSISKLEVYKFLTNWCIIYVCIVRAIFWKNKILVSPGFEPGTFWSEVGCLTNWSNRLVVIKLLIQLVWIIYLLNSEIMSFPVFLWNSRMIALAL